MEDKAAVSGCEDIKEVVGKDSGGKCGKFNALRLSGPDVESEGDKEDAEFGGQGLSVHME